MDIGEILNKLKSVAEGGVLEKSRFRAFLARVFMGGDARP